MSTATLRVPLTIRDLTLDDLPAIDWSGGTSHLTHVAEHIVAGSPDGDGSCRVLGVELPTGELVGKGGVRFAGIDDPLPPGLGQIDVGELWMLAVRESWQSIGVGTALVAALERAVRDRGRSHAMLSVEHDNPRALALYRRLGYTAYDSTLDGWSIGERRHFVTVCTVMVKGLGNDH